MKKITLLLALLPPLAAFAQPYSIDWHKIAGGGGTSTGGVYSVNGTIGQPDASGTNRLDLTSSTDNLFFQLNNP